MDSTRISLARVLELGVQITWREAAAIVHEALARTGPTKGTRPGHVGADECVITRGGEVTLVGGAAEARPETVVRLLEDLLPACDSPGGLGTAYERGMAIAFLEDLSQRTTPKRRRVEVASVALRAIATAADLARLADETAMPEPPAAEVKRRAPEPEAPPPPDAATRPATTLVAPHHTLKVVPPPPAAPAPPAAPEPEPAAFAGPVSEVARLRVEMAARQRTSSRFDVDALRDRLRELDPRKLAAAAVPVALIVAWWLWPVPVPALPDTPSQYDPVALAAIPLVPGWADIDRLGGPAARRASAAAAAAAPVTVLPRPPASSPTVTARLPEPAPEPAIVAEPPADASVALVPPSGEIPAAAIRAGSPAVSAPALAATISRPPPAAPAAAPPAPAIMEATAADTVYSWTNATVEPPAFLSPAMPSWAMPAPTATIEGPYLEVLVDQQGQVETVRVRGRVQPGETYYRHRMILASAKLWQFAPARLNGHPVRYVVRVLIDEP